MSCGFAWTAHETHACTVCIAHTAHTAKEKAHDPEGSCSGESSLQCGSSSVRVGRPEAQFVAVCSGSHSDLTRTGSGFLFQNWEIYAKIRHTGKASQSKPVFFCSTSAIRRASWLFCHDLLRVWRFSPVKAAFWERSYCAHCAQNWGLKNTLDRICPWI